MAAPDLRIVRRRRGALTASAAPHALVAASAPVTDTSQIFRTTGLGGRSSSWQNELWELYDEVGEYAYYVDWLAGSCSRVQWVASEIGDDGRPTGGIAEDNDEGQTVTEIVREMAGGPLGQSELTERAIKILAVPGEHWIAILQRPEGQAMRERWFAVTKDEIGPSQHRVDGLVITLPDGQKHEYNPGKDGLFRVWIPHPRKASEATSPARSCLPSLREIARTTKKIRSIDNSRLIGNGALFISNTANLPAVDAPVSADKPGAGSETPAPPAQGHAARTVQAQFVKVAQTAYTDPDNLAGLVPLVIGVDDVEHAAKHIDFGKEFAEGELKKRNDAIDRFGMGVNMSPERLRGLSTGNHWSAFAVGDSDVQLHIAPMIETLLNAILTNVLRDTLRAENIDPDKYVLWYDTSQLTVDPDKTDEAKDLYAGGAITSDAAVSLSGLPADSVYDLDTPEGAKVFARDAITKNPELIKTYAPLFAGFRGVEFPDPVALPAGNTGSGDDDEESGSDRGEEPDTEGDEPRPIAASASPMSVAIEFGTAKALDLAGKRRVKTNNTALRERLRGVEPHQYHRLMGPVEGGEVAALIKGWDPGLDDLAARYGFDADHVRMVVAQQARRQLTSQVVDGQVG